MFVPHRGAGVMCMPFNLTSVWWTVSFVRLLLIRGGIERNPGPADKFVFRYQYLLIQLGTNVLRKLFDFVVGNEVVQYLTAKSQDIQSLIQARKITADQKQFLPPIDNQPDSSNFNFPLLACLLRNICGLNQPNDPVWTNPAITDTSIAADITRLRLCRNQLIRSEKLRLPEADLNSKLQDIIVILLRLHNVREISNAEIIEIDEQLMEKINMQIRAWHDSDRLLEQRIDKGMSKVSHVKQDFVVGKKKSKKFEFKQQKSKPQQKDKFIFRYQYLLMKLGTDVLRKVFDDKVGNNLLQYLTDKSEDIQKLINARVITADQKMLLPPIDNQPDSSNFNILLLSCLLRNICGLRQQCDHVWKKPAKKDTSIEADITRLRKCRIQLMQCDKLVLPEADLNSKWQHLSAILLRLNNVGRITHLQSYIKNAEIMDIDDILRDQICKTDKAWHKFDRLFKHKIPVDMGEVNKVKQDLVETEEPLERVELTQDFKRPQKVDHTDCMIFSWKLLTVLQKLKDNEFAKYLTSHKAKKTTLQWLIDLSLEADITRLRQCMNCIMTMKHLDDEMSNALGNTLQEILKRLGRRVGITDEFFSSAGDALFDNSHIDMLEQWYDNEQRQNQIEQEYEPKKFFKDSECKIFSWKLLTLGTAVLQKLFDYRVDNDFAKYLTSHEAEKTTLQWLIDTNRITKQQVTLLSEFRQTTLSSNVNRSEQTLLPDNSDETFSSLKSQKLDIPLLTVLLRYICGLRAPNHLVWEEPQCTDLSLEADITRLRQCMNCIMTMKHLNDDMINALGNTLQEILKRLGRRVGIKDEFFSSAGDALFDNSHIDMLEQWYDNEQRQIQIEQGYEPKMFFKDSDDDALTLIDEEKVSVLLGEGKLPNAKQLKTICKKFGSSSPTVRKVCAYICNTLQMTSPHIKRCWPAYVYDKNREKNENDINLVTFVAVKDIKDKLNIDQTFGYDIYELFHGSNSAETSEMMKRDVENADIFDDQIDKVEDCINNNSFTLARSHSNITLIASSTVKSIGYMDEKRIIEKPCVAIYVHKKGYIPLGEKPFPIKLDVFDTDVRESVVSWFENDKAYEKHDELLMGTSISNFSSTGTLGGFVEHSDYGLCGLTCAHTVGVNHLDYSAGVKHWSDEDPKIYVIQPASDIGTIIGKVVCALIRQDNGVGIDIALFRIEDRLPNSGHFAIDAPVDIWTNDYNSGNIVHQREIKQHRGKTVIKFGSETGRTEAKLLSVKSYFEIDRVSLHGQLSVDNLNYFADRGDSGALAFVKENGELKAIGVVVAGNSQRCFVTPLSEILDALKENNTKQVTMKIFEVADNEPMQE